MHTFTHRALILLFFLGSTLAQLVSITNPLANSKVKAGSTITVNVTQPDTIAQMFQVGIALGVDSCGSGVCTPPSSAVGSVLYTGPFQPTFRTPGKQPYQSYDVQIPQYLSKGKALLSVTHLVLIGAAPFPLLEFANITVNIV